MLDDMESLSFKSDKESRYFTDIIIRDAIYNRLFRYCTPATIFRLGRTCRLVRRSVQDYAGRAFDIDKCLSRFFTDPLGFCVLQAETQAIVSGSTALQFMDRTLYKESDLDIYVPLSRTAEVCQWIMASGGKGYIYFALKGRGDRTMTYEDNLRLLSRKSAALRITSMDIDHQQSLWSSTQYRSVRWVLNFRSTTQTPGMDPLRVQVIATAGSPAAAILAFHSTVVLNAITYCATYSLYPKGTFEERRGLVCRTLDVRCKKAITKYEGRGWELETTPITDEEQTDPNSAFHFEDRWICDRKTWVIPFDTNKITQRMSSSRGSLTLPLSPSIDPFTLNSFGVEKGPIGTSFKMALSLLKPVFFEHCYTAFYEFAVAMQPWFTMIRRMGVIDWENPSGGRKFDRFLVKWKEEFVEDSAE
ncbi:hypothetical protein M0805_003310 [Coniferiporia weirii]|nr:hypothetical protein M0805_003310 [Coniferiporia weirii]